VQPVNVGRWAKDDLNRLSDLKVKMDYNWFSIAAYHCMFPPIKTYGSTLN
jgi:hypothetical protein